MILRSKVWPGVLFAGLSLAAGSALASPPTLQVQGQPFFPLGWYTSWGSPSVEASGSYLGTMRSQGMNTALICYGVWTADSLMTNQLEAAIPLDMKIMVEVNRYAVLEQYGYTLAEIDRQVDLLKGYSSLLNWYLIDEPEVQGLSPAATQARYAQVKGRDPAHSISVVHYAYQALNPQHPAEGYLAAEPPPYCDVLMTDTYPVSGQAPEFGNALWEVALQSRVHTQLAQAHGKLAYINVVQTHGEWGLRIPTYAENRYLTYAPVVMGARGLLYWMHNAFTTDGHRDRVVPAAAHEIQSLAAAVMANSTAVSVTSGRDADTTGHGVPDVSYLFAADEGAGYLLAVNNTPGALSVGFQLTGGILPQALGSASADVAVLFEQRSVVVQPTGNPAVWTMSDTFSPYDVNVYRLYSIVNTGATADPPAKVAPAWPPHGSKSVHTRFDLTWRAAERATSYDVYFGTANPPPLCGNQAGTLFDPGVMANDTVYYWRVDAVNSRGVTAGDTMSFTTVALNLPGPPGSPSPADGAQGVDVQANLGWSWAASARSYKVYLGTGTSPSLLGSTTGFTFEPGTLQPCTTYYWRIDPVNDDGTSTGPTRSFTTVSASPVVPGNPQPADRSTPRTLRTDLRWSGAGASSYRVCWGMTDPPPFTAQVSGNVFTYDPGGLLPHTRYYWRVDAVNACTTVSGPVWTFTSPPLPGDLDLDDDVDQADFGRFQACLTGSGRSYEPGCEDADFEPDGDVDQSDFAIFQGCMSGANVPADPNCAN